MNAQQRTVATVMFLCMTMIGTFMLADLWSVRTEVWEQFTILLTATGASFIVAVGFMFTISDPEVEEMRQKLMGSESRNAQAIRFVRGYARREVGDTFTEKDLKLAQAFADKLTEAGRKNLKEDLFEDDV